MQPEFDEEHADLAVVKIAPDAAEDQLAAGGRGRGRGRGRGAAGAKATAKAGVAKDGDWLKSPT